MADVPVIVRFDGGNPEHCDNYIMLFPDMPGQNLSEVQCYFPGSGHTVVDYYATIARTRPAEREIAENILERYLKMFGNSMVASPDDADRFFLVLRRTKKHRSECQRILDQSRV